MVIPEKQQEQRKHFSPIIFDDDDDWTIAMLIHSGGRDACSTHHGELLHAMYHSLPLFQQPTKNFHLLVLTKHSQHIIAQSCSTSWILPCSSPPKPTFPTQQPTKPHI
jgi:hypothetical protein